MSPKTNYYFILPLAKTLFSYKFGTIKFDRAFNFTYCLHNVIIFDVMYIYNMKYVLFMAVIDSIAII